MLLLRADDLRTILEPELLRLALADGYSALSSGETHVPTRVMAEANGGLLGAMPGFVDGIGLAAKLVSVFPDNAKHSLPSHHALVMLFDSETGVPLALMDGEVITEMRTSGSAALACDLLAPGDASVLTVIGAGVQAAGHLEAFASLRSWKSIRLANRTPAHAHALAKNRPEVTVVESIEEAVHGSDVVACTTDSKEPLFPADAFDGSHLSSVGLHLEIPPDLLTNATVVVQSRAAVSTPPPNGPVAVQGMDPDDVVELGELVTGGHPGGTRQRTVWLSVGNGMEDVVAARLAYDRAIAAGIGEQLDL